MPGYPLTATAGSSTTYPGSSAVPGQPPAGQPTFVPGAHQDPADFYGLFGAVVIIVAVIAVIRRAFRPPRPPRPPRPQPVPDEPPAPDGPPRA